MTLIPFFCLMAIVVLLLVFHGLFFYKSKTEKCQLFSFFIYICILAFAIVSAHLNSLLDLTATLLILGISLKAFSSISGTLIKTNNNSNILEDILGFGFNTFLYFGIFILSGFNNLVLIIALLFALFCFLFTKVAKLNLSKIKSASFMLHGFSCMLFLSQSIVTISKGPTTPIILMLASALIITANLFIEKVFVFKNKNKLLIIPFVLETLSLLLICSAIFTL